MLQEGKEAVKEPTDYLYFAEKTADLQIGQRYKRTR